MMKIIKPVTLLFLCIYSYAIFGQTIREDSKIHKGKLKNGLTYYILPNNNSGERADFYLIQKTGSLVEEKNQQGLAHFLEHMAFRGTKNFPGKLLLDRLENIGVSFGADINAHTNYEETVYRLTDIPLNTKEVIETALRVLHDWSGFISNNIKDIEQERGVVREEWRTSNNAAKRILEEVVYPSVFVGSPYANRIPIGKLSVINEFKPEELWDYYHKWYRPDLQSILIVGAVDREKVETQITKIFNEIPAPTIPLLPREPMIIENKHPVIIIASDKELPNINIDIYSNPQRYPKNKKTTKEYYKLSMIQKIIGNLMINRFVNLKKMNQSLYGSINVNVGSFLVDENSKSLSLNIIPVERDSTLIVLKWVLTELDRVRRFGFTDSELDNYKKGALQLIEREYAYRNKRENADYSRDLIKMICRNEPFPDAKWSYENGKQIMSELSKDTLNQVVKDLISDPNLLFILTAPDKDLPHLPNKESILKTWSNIKQTDLLPYFLPSMEKRILPELKVKWGKVSKTVKQSFGFTEWKLNNGAHVQFKQTNESNGDFYIWAYSEGGKSVLDEADLPSALAMNYIVNKQGSVDPDGKAKITFSVNEYDETIGGKTNDIKEVENLFKLLYLGMTEIKTESSVFDEYIKLKKIEIINLNPSPKDILSDSVNSIVNNRSFRAAISLNDLSTLEKVKYDQIIKIYKDRFGNAGDFRFFITGNINPDHVKRLVEKYIGSLPSSGKKEKSINNGVILPKGIIRKHFTTAMKIPQSTITICYTGMLPLSVKNQLFMDVLTGLLKIKCNEKMRKEEGGTYGIWVGAEIVKVPVSQFVFQLNFDTDTVKRNKLIKLAYSGINEIMIKPDLEDLKKVKQNLLKLYKQKSTNKDAYYWIDKAWMHHVYGIDGKLNYERLLSSITPEKIRDFAKQIFTQGNLIEVVMDPLF